jgi:hypothetical protein
MTYPQENFKVEGPACKSKETRGFLCKAAKVKAGLTGGGGFDSRMNGSDPLDQDPAVAAARRRGVAGGPARTRVKADPSCWIVIQWCWTRACAQEAAAGQRRRGRGGA